MDDRELSRVFVRFVLQVREAIEAADEAGAEDSPHTKPRRAASPRPSPAPASSRPAPRARLGAASSDAPATSTATPHSRVSSSATGVFRADTTGMTLGNVALDSTCARQTLFSKPPRQRCGSASDPIEGGFDYSTLLAEEAAAPVAAIPAHLIRAMQAAAREEKNLVDLAERGAHFMHNMHMQTYMGMKLDCGLQATRTRSCIQPISSLCPIQPQTQPLSTPPAVPQCYGTRRGLCLNGLTTARAATARMARMSG